ncbi:IS1245 transposase [Leifsonia xyli subsp. cynodontis DSM 46306]|uniref:Antitoxin VbhA domain-containing protein n=1 Tax=Leifsonia xyli subsp. cynodontis DSM 46306 TaxID=1389489 RepID=U3PC51_LEIXC|nr:IS1245 transposase [Leifsonia xyli subsp. cynodontis DSM 46306]
MSISRTERQTVIVPGLDRPIDVENVMAEIEKSHQLAGHFPDVAALERARRVLTGEISEEVAMREIREAFREA